MIDNYRCRNCNNVCLLFYEDFLDNPKEYIRKIATFMGVEQYDLDEIKRKSSKEFMLEYESQFKEKAFIEFMTEIGRNTLEFKLVPKVTNGNHQTSLVATDDFDKIIKEKWEL